MRSKVVFRQALFNDPRTTNRSSNVEVFAAMTAYPIKKALAIAAIPLLLQGCGDKPKASAPPEPQAANPAAPPKVLPSTLKVKRQSKTYLITGIGMGGTNSVAIINDQVVTPGMEIDSGVVLKEIHPTYATIAIGNSEYLLRPESIQNELDRK